MIAFEISMRLLIESRSNFGGVETFESKCQLFVGKTYNCLPKLGKKQVKECNLKFMRFEVEPKPKVSQFYVPWNY